MKNAKAGLPWPSAYSLSFVKPGPGEDDED